MPTVDSLDIQITTSATSANKALDKLASTIAGVQRQLGKTTSVSGFNSLRTATTRLNNDLVKTQKVSKNTTAGFAKMAISTRALRVAIEGIGKSIKSSMDYIETLNYFNNAWAQVAEKADLSVFEDLGYETADAYVKSFSERARQVTSQLTGFNVLEDGSLTSTGQVSLGIDPNQVMNYQAMFGQMASSIGLTSENSLLLSEALTKIGADLASVKNMDFDKVWKDMASGLAGMSRTLDKYGVNIRNVNLQQKLLDLGINANIANLNQNDKAMLRTIILLESTGYAYGDLAETINAPSNQLRLLKANFTNLARTIGNLFLPVVQTVLPYINGLVIALQRLFTWVGSLIGLDFSDLTSSVSSVGGSDFSDLIDDTDDLTDGMDKASKSAKKMKDYLLGIDELNVIKPEEDSGTDALSGIGASGGLLDDAFKNAINDYLSEWDKAFAELENKANDIANRIASFFIRIWDYAEPAREALNRLWNEGFALFGDFALGTLSDFYYEFLVPIGKWTLGQGLPRFFDITNKLLKNIKWDKLRKSLSDFYKELERFAEFVFDGVLDFYEYFLVPIGEWGMNKAIPYLVDTISDFASKINWNKLNNALSAFWEVVSKFAVGIGNGLVNFLEASTPYLTSALSGIINGLATAFEFLFNALNMIPENIITALGGAIAGILVTFVTYKGVNSIMDSIKLAWIGLYVAIDDGLKLISAHPLVAIATGVAGIVGAIVALEEQAQKESQIATYGQTVEELASSISKVSDEVNRNSESIRDYVDNAGLAEMRMVENLTDKYYGLAEQESLTATEKETMKNIVSQLSDLMPDLNAYIDEETGLITAQKDEVLKLVEAKREQYRLEAISSQMKSAYETQLTAEQNLATALENAKTAQSNYNTELEKYNEQMALYESSPMEYTYPDYIPVLNAREEWELLSSELEEAKTAYDNVGDSISWLEEQMATAGENTVKGYTNGVVNNSNSAIYEVENWMSEVNKAIHDSELEFGSPSKKTWQYGADTITGFNNGITENQSSSNEAIDGWLSSISDMFSLDKWSELFGNIGTALETKWGEITTWWSETTLSKWFEEDVKPWFTAEKWSELYSTIKTELENKWGEVVNWWTTSGIYRWYNDNVKQWFSKDKWSFAGIKDGLKAAWENAVEAVKTVWNDFANWFNSKMEITLPKIEIAGETIFDGKSIEFIKLPTFNTGGFPESASLFWANENGIPEMVGTIGGRTAVASGVEITGIQDAVYATGQTEASLLQTAVSLLQIIADKEFGVDLDGRELLSALDERRARNGYAF